MSFAHPNGSQTTFPDFTALYGGRWRVTRRTEVRNASQIVNTLFPAEASADPTATTAATSDFSDLHLIDRRVMPGDKAGFLTLTYETLTATFVDEVAPVTQTGEDGRSIIERTVIALPDADASALIIGADYQSTHVAREVINLSTDFCKRFRLTYIQATSTPAQIGNVVLGDIEGAFIGTHETTFIYVNGTTKPARSFTYQYVVSGDGTAVAANWLACNATLAASGDLPERYFIGSQIVRRGTSYTIISRLYYEKPATFSFPRFDTYFFEGKIGTSGNMVVMTQEPQTKFTKFEIRESYHIGPIDPDALTWEVSAWASGSLAYRPANNNTGGVDGYYPFNFNGCIGSQAISQTNGYFLGIKVTNVTGTVSSIPDTYPTGQKLIRSTPARWTGQIWKKTNIYVTYP